jgi:F-type H+-transporting ATPase subunit alpha
VIQIYAATNGYVDRITVDRVPEFMTTLTESVRGNEPELLKAIAGGDWSEGTQSAVEAFVTQFADDFGFDLDEEGHPIDVEAPARAPRLDQAEADAEHDTEAQAEREPVEQPA